MDITESNWKAVTKLVTDSMKSTFCCGVGTVGADGAPHVTPIGSLVFTDVGKGFYFEQMPVRIGTNIRHTPGICIMAVNSSRMYWLKFFLTGKFRELPGIRLYGTAGEKRAATHEEQHLWKDKVKSFKKLKGYDVLWKDLNYGREVNFHSFEPVQCGRLTETAVLKLNK